MVCQFPRLIFGVGVLGVILAAPLPSAAQRPGPAAGPPSASSIPGAARDSAISLRVLVRSPNGGLVDMAIVTVRTMTGGLIGQATTDVGQAEFPGLEPGDYSVQVVAAGYQTAETQFTTSSLGSILYVDLKPSDPNSVEATGPGMPVLAPKVQKYMAKALEALRAGKPDGARSPLEDAYHLAPGHPYVNFLYGIYSAQKKDWPAAESHWKKALDAYPKYMAPLLFLSDALLRENRVEEAIPYLHRAIEIQPAAWRPHAMLAEAYLAQRDYDKVGGEADRALELGHSEASGALLLKARALLAKGDTKNGIPALQSYVRERPTDTAAQKLLDSVTAAPVPVAAPVAAPAARPTPKPPPPPAAPAAAPVSPPPLPASAWMPPDVDDKVPAVEPGVPCSLDNVLRHVSHRMTELVSNVDRFTATETLVDEHINDYGAPYDKQVRSFNYLVMIVQPRPGYLSVEELRDGDPAYSAFPDHTATLGFPALVLLFHPLESSKFEFTCEGLARTPKGLTWLVHFQQKPGEAENFRVYQTSKGDFSIPLKGRAWIAADSYQVVRLETDLVSPVPEIRLAAEHTAIEYGPVRFPKKKVSLWLPQSVEIYFDWRGLRVHRRHSYSDYVLFSVEDEQKILPPKAAQETPPPVTPPGSSPPPSQQPRPQ
jgi:tetratricopeptide (TPR) repeat protein